jgi:hypothetical protein
MPKCPKCGDQCSGPVYKYEGKQYCSVTCIRPEIEARAKKGRAVRHRQRMSELYGFKEEKDVGTEN